MNRGREGSRENGVLYAWFFIIFVLKSEYYPLFGSSYGELAGMGNSWMLVLTI